MPDRHHRGGSSGDPDDPRKRQSMSKLTSTGAPAEAASKATAAEERTRDELYLRATELGINGRSRMTKQALATAIARREAEER